MHTACFLCILHRHGMQTSYLEQVLNSVKCANTASFQRVEIQHLSCVGGTDMFIRGNVMSSITGLPYNA